MCISLVYIVQLDFVEKGWGETVLLLLERKLQLEISKQFLRTHLSKRRTDFPKF